jgi:hypothetical protein
MEPVIPSNSIFQLSPKYNISPFQSRSGCLQVVPVSLFRIIQNYSEEKDYRNLINSDLSFFQGVKYETAFFSLEVAEEAIHTIQAIINAVKDKSKQISLSINPLLLSKAAQLMDGIGTVSIRCFHTQKFLQKNHLISLKNFDTIMRLNLHEIEGISEINLDLHSLTELDIKNGGFRRILAWNSRKILKVVNINSCGSLISIPALDDIPFIDLVHTALEELQSNGNHIRFQLFDFPTARVQNQIQAQMPSLFQHLQDLELCCCFPLDFTDFSFYQHIPVVTLTQQVDGNLPSLPPFYGGKITLDQFCLSSWSKQPLVTVRECRLKNCVGLKEFPVMPHLTLLHLFSSNDVIDTSSSEMNSLLVFSVDHCDELSTISVPSCLREFKLSYCDKMSKIPTIGHVQKITIWGCDRLEKIDALENVVKATISHCKKLSVIEKISSTPSQYLKAVKFLSKLSPHYNYFPNDVQLDCLPAIKRLQIQNVSTLGLDELPRLRTLHGIGQLYQLEIKGCHALMSTEGLGSVSDRLTLSNCSNLSMLKGLATIPKVYILECNSNEGITLVNS